MRDGRALRHRKLGRGGELTLEGADDQETHGSIPFLFIRDAGLFFPGVVRVSAVALRARSPRPFAEQHGFHIARACPARAVVASVARLGRTVSGTMPAGGVSVWGPVHGSCAPL